MKKLGAKLRSYASVFTSKCPRNKPSFPLCYRDRQRSADAWLHLRQSQNTYVAVPSTALPPMCPTSMAHNSLAKRLEVSFPQGKKGKG